MRDTPRRAALPASAILLTMCVMPTAFAQTLRTADTDADGIEDSVDNCTTYANADQRDTDADLFGNECDPDLNDDGTVNFVDLGLLKAVFSPNPPDPDADFNGDGFVNFIDLGRMKELFFTGETPGPGPSGAATQAVSIQTTLAFPQLPGFQQLTTLVQAPGDNTRWFATELVGRIRVFDNDPAVTGAASVLTITDRVETDFIGEAGLLGLAFHPDFPATPYAYVSYTADGPNFQTPLLSRISRFTTNDGGLTLDAGSEVIILEIPQPATNHNGGNVAFGPDGLLYAGYGDGGSGGDPWGPIGNGQNTSTLLGAFLRIDVDVSAGDFDAGVRYYIPPDNPFAAGSGCGDTGCREIYAWGVRNPWRWSFDSVTGTLWAGDVGQGSREEVDIIELGNNYGWRCYEGVSAFNLAQCGDPGQYTFPVHDYSQAGEPCAVTGGYVYRGGTIPALDGVFVYGDYCSGELWGIDQYGKPLQNQLLDTPFAISTFGQDQDGEVYLVNYVDGRIYRIDPG